MLCTKFQVFRSKTVTGSFRTYIHTYGQTYIHTYRGPKQGKPGRNRNSSQGSVLVSGHYWFVKQCWLVNITGLYRVQVSEKYRFLPQRFNIHTYIHTEDRNRGNPVETKTPRRARYWLVNITGL